MVVEIKCVQHIQCIFARLMHQWTWNTCAVLLWGLTFASNCVRGSFRHRHRIRARQRQIRLGRIRRGWSKIMVRKNYCPRIEQSRSTENNNVCDLQQFLKSRFANATTWIICRSRSQWNKVRTRPAREWSNRTPIITNFSFAGLSVFFWW